MRISPQQIATIVQTIRSIAGEAAQVWLFGSRLDDNGRGGDVDLLVESSPVTGLIERARIKYRLEQQLQLPVDVLAARFGDQDSPFGMIARAHAIRLTPLNDACP